MLDGVLRAVTLAGRLMALEAAAALDRQHLLKDEAAGTRLALLIPIVKSWCSDRGVDVASLGVQVHRVENEYQFDQIRQSRAELYRAPGHHSL